jgi:hypothetical protein
MCRENPLDLPAKPACGNSECCCSMDIAGYITHGWGELDEYGFWEFPCPSKAHKVEWFEP